MGRLPSEILKSALAHGKQKVKVTPDEFEHIKTFRKAILLSEDDALDDERGIILLRNGSKIIRSTESLH